MILASYDTYPYMLVHQAMKLPNDEYRWVSGWHAGHQNLGTWPKGHSSLLAVLSTRDGERLEEDLKRLTNEHRALKDCLHLAYMLKRDALLTHYPVRLPRGVADLHEI
jgi:hypothetical protein